MSVNPLPESVWMYYYPNVEGVEEKSQRIFDRILADEEYANLVGAHNGETLRITPGSHQEHPEVFQPVIQIFHRKIVEIKSHKEMVEAAYSLSQTEHGPELTMLNFRVPDAAHRMGLGTRMFAEVVEAARAFGFKEIIAYADNDKGRNGHYTWPRLGFDKLFTERDKERLPDQLKHFTRLSDVMDQEQARELWREKGIAFEMRFDTTLQSRSMQRLNEALERLQQKGGYWDGGPDTLLRIERGAYLRPRRDWIHRIWKYKEKKSDHPSRPDA